MIVYLLNEFYYDAQGADGFHEIGALIPISREPRIYTIYTQLISDFGSMQLQDRYFGSGGNTCNSFTEKNRKKIINPDNFSL